MTGASADQAPEPLARPDAALAQAEHGKSFELAYSVGVIAFDPERHAGIAEVLDSADRAMDVAKRARHLEAPTRRAFSGPAQEIPHPGRRGVPSRRDGGVQPMNKMLAALVLALMTVGSVEAGVLEKLGLKNRGPSDETVAKGLKEALAVGTGNTVARTGIIDGYFKNEAIRILMPEKLRSMDKGLRAVGLGPKLDEFVLSMNRAAERAAPAAKDIFTGAIKEMTFTDARKILNGGDTAATEYFRAKTSATLAQSFRPLVSEALGEAGTTRQYKSLVAKASSIPFLGAPSLDLDEYVTGKALDGLFVVLGEEERKIRKDPAARVTQILKDVFGAGR